jgi:hypothetical protein
MPKKIQLQSELKHIFREKIILIMFLLPILLPILFRVIISMIIPYVQTLVSFTITPYLSYILSITLLLSPYAVGVVMGFIMLDDKDGKIAELLSITPSVRSKLNFWVPKKSNSHAELDYVLPWNDILVPIEVKSGASGTLRSLHRFVDEAPHDIAVRIYAGSYKVENTKTISGKKFRLINLPFYLIGEIETVLQNTYF